MNAGVLAFGDSITNGGGELQWGVALQSWALWVGARARAAVHGLRGRRRARPPTSSPSRSPRSSSARRSRTPATTVGCLYIGVNDVRAPDWDPARFAADHATAHGVPRASAATACCWSRSRRTSGARARRGVAEANAIIERAAGEHVVLDLRGFGARNLVMTDHVHPTAFGQVWIAERALRRALGMDVRVRPSALISPGERGRRRALQGDWTYVYRALKEAARAAVAARRAARAAAARSDSPRTAAGRTPAGP